MGAILELTIDHRTFHTNVLNVCPTVDYAPGKLVLVYSRGGESLACRLTRPVKFCGLACQGIRAELINCLTKYSKIIFKLIILCGSRMMR